LGNAKTRQYTAPFFVSVPGNVRAVAIPTASSGWVASVDTVAYYGPPPPNLVSLATSVSENDGSTTISLSAKPQTSVFCYAVVETIPFGLTPSDLMANGAQGGEWDPADSVIRWGPYLDDDSRTFSFEVSGPAGIYPFSDQVSFNGYSTTTTISLPVSMPVADTTPPALSITSVADGDSEISADLLVSGTASDSGRGNNGISLVTVDGLPANNDTASGAGTADWSADVQLHTGPNTIVVVATDTVGNSTNEAVTVTYNPPTFGATSIVSGGSGGTQSLQTQLSGLSQSKDTIILYESTDLQNWTEVMPQPLMTWNGSTVTISIPIIPTTTGTYFRVTVTQSP
ncbi:MAG TPA: hypothetical protein VMH30_11140, partial [Verrucomicrobiae bacterium]|nr:hypothetical protein [Verrucomicrobiae bacterium]